MRKIVLNKDELRLKLITNLITIKHYRKYIDSEHFYPMYYIMIKCMQIISNICTKLLQRTVKTITKLLQRTVKTTTKCTKIDEFS